MPTDPSITESSTRPMRLSSGVVVGRYEIDGWVRDGGMASLYRSHHVKTGARVAIKVQRTGGHDDRVTAARFDREGEVMGRLSGVPNVVQVHDVDALPDGRRYLVMEWIEGDNLEERLDDLRNDDQQFELDRACRLLKDVALALDAAHRAAVVHRDLKPSNIMLDRSHPDRETAKLVDFGISADLGSDGQTGELTATGVVLGTSGYCAPEQAIGLPADPGFDIYSFGVVMFETLTGYPLPPEGMGPEQLPPVTELRADVPLLLARLVSQCLERNPTKRPPSAGALVERIDEVLQGLEHPRQQGGGDEPAMHRPATHRRPSSDALRISDVERIRDGTEHPIAEQPRIEASNDANDANIADDEPSPKHDARSGLRPGWILTGLLLAAVAVAVAWHCSLAEIDQTGNAITAGFDGDGPAATPTDHGRDDENVAMLASTGQTVPSAPPSTIAELEPTTADMDAVESTGSSSNGAPGVEPGSTGASTSGGSAPRPDSSTGSHCQASRRKAARASGRREWATVLRATSDRRCWISKAQRTERTALRVEALAELGRFEQCVDEGAGSTEPRVARRTKFCRSRLRDGSG